MYQHGILRSSPRLVRWLTLGRPMAA